MPFAAPFCILRVFTVQKQNPTYKNTPVSFLPRITKHNEFKIRIKVAGGGVFSTKMRNFAKQHHAPRDFSLS